MKRKIVLDTETTGLKPEEGHRIVEIGAVEIVQEGDNYVKTGRTFQVYLNPDRESDPEAEKVHGLTREFLRTKPRFSEVVDEFLDFIKDSEVVIHNADFDIKFLNSELDRCNRGKLWDHIKNAICTLKLDKRLFSEERKHTLDAMCARFGIDNSNRTLHGALLDSDLLADCFIKTHERYSASDIEADLEQTNWVRPPIKRYKNISFKKVEVTEVEEENHLNLLNSIVEKEKTTPVFFKNTQANLKI